MPMKTPKLLIVTDLGLLRAYRRDLTPKGTPRLELLDELHLEDAHRRILDGVTDFAGRRTGPRQTCSGAPMSDAHNLKLEIRRRLIRRIAGHIARLMMHRKQEGVWLAAPREINHLILDELPRGIRPRIEVNLARDLVKAGQRELLHSFPRPELLIRPSRSFRTEAMD